MKSAGVGGGGGGRSEREDTGGQLLKELEALSQALYNAGGQRQQHAGPPAPSRMESWSSGSSSRSDEEPPQSPYNLGPGSRRREVITPPSPGVRLGTTTRHEQVATAPLPRSPFLSSVSSRQDHQLPRSPYQLRARNVVDVSPKSPFLGSSIVRDVDKFASPYLGARRDSLAEPPSPQLGAVKRDGPPSPYLGTRRDQEPPPSSPYVGARSRDPEPPSSPYLGGARSRDPEPPSSPYLGGARSRDQEPPASPYLGAKRDHLQEPSSSPYLGSRRGEQRYSSSFHGSARMEPKSPFLGTIEESGTAASPYLAGRNGFRSSSFSPGGQEVRSPHMLQQQGRSDSLPPLRALSESFPRPPGAGGLTPLMLSSAAADAALGSPAKTRTLSIDRDFSSPARVAAPAPSPTSFTKRSETYRLDAPRRATSLNPRQLEEQGEREEEGQQQGYALLQPWHSQGFERNLPEVTNFPAWLEDNVKFSQKLEAPPKEKKGFWNWKPFRAIARIAQQRFHCVFTMHVHGIEGLPATMNGLRLSVSWKRKEAMTQTVPSRVFQGSAEFEETLSLKSTIYGSKSGAGDIKYEPKNFDLAVIALDIDSLVLGTHRLDLTRLLPANPEKNSTTLDDEEKRWMTSFNLAGKAKGGTLVVTFGYQLLLGKDSQQLLSSSLLSSRYMDSSPLMKPLLRSYNSLPNSPQGLSVPHHHHHHHAGRSSDAQYSPAMSEPPSMDYEYMMGMEHLNLDESSTLEKPYMLGRNALRAYSRPESLQAFRDSGLLSSSSTTPSFFSHTTDSTLTPPTPPRFASADEQPAAATTPPQERSKQEAHMQPRDDDAEEEELVQEDDDDEGGDEFVVVDRGLENGTMLQHFSSRGFGDIEAAEDMVRMDDEEQEEVDEELICDEQQEEEEEEQIAEDPADIGEEEEVVIDVDSLTREERFQPAVGEMEISADTSQKAELREEPCTGEWEEEDSSNSSPKEEPLTGQDSSEEAGNGVGAAAALELLDHVEEEDRDREIPGIDDGEMQELLDVMDAHGEECGKGDERSRNVEFFLIQENENENNVARITRHQDCMQSPISILQEETTSRQGKSWAEEEENEENDDDYDNDEMDKREKREKSTHHKKLDETATKNREHAGLEEEEEENDDDDDDDDMDKREKREKSAHREKLDETATKNRERAGLEEEEEAEEVQKAKQEAKRSIILNSDDEIDLVAGEFLNLLEKEGELSAAAGLMSSDSEADSPRAQVLKQFEQEALIEGRIGLGFNLAEDSFEHSHNGSLHNNRNLKMGAPDNHAHSMNKPSSHVGNLSPSGWSSEEDLELVAIMEAAELELQKAIQMMRSKTRAQALEDEETEALMNEWGLNTKVFEGSPPPTRPSKLDNYNDNSAAAALLVPPLLPMSPPPSLGRGLGPVIPVHGGGCLRSMSAVHFPGGCDEGSARLVMQVSKPLVVSSEMGSTSLDILRRMATAGMEGMAVQAMMTMPLEDITGMTVDRISSQGLAALGGNSYSQGNHRNGYQALGPRESGQGIILGSEAAPYGGSRNALGNQAGSGLHTYTRGSDRKPNQMANSSFNPYMSLEDLAPNAMEKIEALAMEGLKIQSEMTENYAPYSVDALSWQQEREAINGGGGGGGFKVKQGGEGIEKLEGASALHLLEGGHLAVGTTSDIFNNDLMSTAISLDEWMRLDAGICDEETSKSSLATVAAHNALHQNMIVMEKDEDSGKTCNRNKGGFLGTNTLTLAMLIQLHDPLRDYEPVGAPMMALVQAERVMVPSSPRAKLGRCISQKGNSEEDEHSSVSPAPQQQQQFKIVDITVSGLKIDDNSTTTTGGGREVGWGNQRQQQSGSRWLVANGMSKSLKHQVLKTKAPPPPPSLPATPAKFKVQKGETLWSISSLIHGTGTKWQEVAALNPHIRNPDVIFANTTIRTR